MIYQKKTIPSRDKIVLTPNRRLTNALRSELAPLGPTLEHACQPCGHIMAIEDWLMQLWLDTLPHNISIVDDFEATCTWESIIQQSPDTSLRSSWQLAVSAYDAYKTSVTHGISLSEPAFDLDHNGQLFKNWAHLFEQPMQQHNSFCLAHLPQQCQIILPQHRQLPHTIELYGFTQHHPIMADFLTALAQHTHVVTLPLKSINGIVTHHRCANTEDEISQMAYWAKHQAETLNSRAQVACVVPKLHQQRDKIERLFSEIFDITPSSKKPYNISAGEPLPTVPIVRTALMILKNLSGNCDSTSCSEILRSPYINSALHIDAHLAASADMALRQQEHPIWQNDLVLEMLQQKAAHFPGQTLLERWTQFMTAWPQKNQTVTQWLTLYEEKLTAIGWPGQQALNSTEYQAHQRWQQALQSFKSYHNKLGQLTHERMLTILQHYLNTCVFQAESRDCRIQILGLLEASGNQFDAMWIMGLDAKSWPMSAQPNPFIPNSLAKRYQLPRSSAIIERQFAETHQKILLQSADVIRLSSAKQQDGIPCDASPLIKHITISTPAKSDACTTTTKNNHTENYIVGHAPAIMKSEQALPGGSAIIDQQNTCPFKAQISCRLRPKKPKRICNTISEQMQGMILHKALERIWRELKTHTALQQAHDLKKQIAKHVKISMQAFPLQNRLAETQAIYFTDILHDWLQHEKARSPFKVIATEQKKTIHINDYTLNICVDRIDEVAPNKLMVIDYKSSQHINMSHCQGNQATMNQLALYSCYGPCSDKTIAATYACPQGKAKRWFGIADPDQASFTPIKHNTKRGTGTWADTTDNWRTHVENTLSKFVSGIADIAPIYGEQTCQFCDYSSICRRGFQT